MVKENLALKDTVKTLELRVADLNSRLQENPNSMFSEEMQVPAIFMDTLGRDISIVKAEVGQSGFRRDLELSKLRDDITLLRSTCQTLQIQLFSLALRKKTYSQADSNLSPKNSTKL